MTILTPLADRLMQQIQNCTYNLAQIGQAMSAHNTSVTLENVSGAEPAVSITGETCLARIERTGPNITIDIAPIRAQVDGLEPVTMQIPADRCDNEILFDQSRPIGTWMAQSIAKTILDIGPQVRVTAYLECSTPFAHLSPPIGSDTATFEAQITQGAMLISRYIGLNQCVAITRSGFGAYSAIRIVTMPEVERHAHFDLDRALAMLERLRAFETLLGPGLRIYPNLEDQSQAFIEPISHAVRDAVENSAIDAEEEFENVIKNLSALL